MWIAGHYVPRSPADFGPEGEKMKARMRMQVKIMGSLVACCLTIASLAMSYLGTWKQYGLIMALAVLAIPFIFGSMVAVAGVSPSQLYICCGTVR